MFCAAVFVIMIVINDYKSWKFVYFPVSFVILFSTEMESVQSEDLLDSFDTHPDAFESSTFLTPSKSPLLDPNPRRRKLSKSRVNIIAPNWGSAQLIMFPSRLEFNLFTCNENSIRVCMYTKPKIDMVIPTSPNKGIPTNLKPQLDKVLCRILWFDYNDSLRF